MDFSIIIAHCGPGLGLWATVTSCEADLAGSTHQYEYVIVSNGGPVSDETQIILRFLKDTGKLVHVHTDEVLTPPAARSLGVKAASGKILCFFDNHCLVSRRYFDRLVADMAKHNMSMLHSATRFFVGDIVHYHYRLQLKERFWGCTGTLPPSTALPYRIAAAGHGGFAVRRDVWDAVGGYGPDSLYKGYGGEEFSFDLKVWRMGFDNWIDPKLEHFHWAGNRPYSRHYTDDYYTNLLTSAFVIGGDKWLNAVYESFATKNPIRLNPERHMFDLLQTAHERGCEYSRELDSKAQFSLDDVLRTFDREQIAYQ
jgi:glycosyltransferase involved in cell wall biosynthesis